MTLQQIRYFISVAESGSISEAAKRLFTAQSSISSAIKEIENTYDITAFIRESTGVRLTRSGEELLIEFKGILSRLDYLDEKYNGSKKRPLGLSVSAQHHICGMASFISYDRSPDTNPAYTDLIIPNYQVKKIIPKSSSPRSTRSSTSEVRHS